MSPARWFRLVGFCSALIVTFALVPGRSGSSEPSDDVDLSVSEGGKEFVNSVGIKLVRIKAGTFLMGSLDSETSALDSEKPQHEVEITKDFYLGVYEVTQKQFRTLLGNNPSSFSAQGASADRVKGLDTDDFPVETISWHDAQAFVKKLNDLPREKAAGRKYRLPTEAEWEYACRAGTKTRFHTGDTLTAKEANISTNGLNRPCKVGSYKPNAWGLYDMHGNVWEYCDDWHDPGTYKLKVRKDPRGPKNPTASCVQRGGGWSYVADVGRSAFRNNPGPTSRDPSYGMRVACDVRRN